MIKFEELIVTVRTDILHNKIQFLIRKKITTKKNSGYNNSKRTYYNIVNMKFLSNNKKVKFLPKTIKE